MIDERNWFPTRRIKLDRLHPSRALRYAAEYKDLDEPLSDFIKRKGGINRCAARFAGHLGRGSSGKAAPERLQWLSVSPQADHRSIPPFGSKLR
jgi:hypothetical protein